jgi:predicted O-linked N-acetylglucosamine transferase (SPINDLY family)
MEIVERVGKGELIDPAPLEVYEDSPNSAEKFLAHHAHAMLDLRHAQQHLMTSLEAIDYSDQKVLNQFVSISSFLGLTDLRCGPIVKFGASAIGRRENALGLEAIQNAVAYDLTHNGAFTSDRESCQFIAMQYERAAQSVAWANTQSLEYNNKQTRIALIVSGLADDDPASRAVRGLAKHHDAKRYKLCVYSTEAGARRDKQQFAPSIHVPSSVKRGAATLDLLGKLKVQAWLAGTDGDLIASARQLADQLVKDRIDVAIFDTTQADPIAAIVAGWEVARVKINFCRRTPLYVAGLSCVSYFDQARYEADKNYWQSKHVDSRYILDGVDVDEDLVAGPQRSTYGIPEQALVLATAGSELDKTVSPELVDAAINILRAHPHAIYLLVGEGELSWQKRKFESAGVAKRVGYAGKRKDLPGFLRIADVYLAEFPAAGAAGVLGAMTVERPVVAIRWGDSAEQSQAAALVGSEATVAGRDANAYVERVSKIVREGSYRAKLGKLMKERVMQHFAFSQTARHIEQMCDQLIQQKTDAQTAAAPTEDAQPLAAVA